MNDPKPINRLTVRANTRVFDLVLGKWVYATTCGAAACRRRTVSYILSNPSAFSFTAPTEIK